MGIDVVIVEQNVLIAALKLLSPAEMFEFNFYALNRLSTWISCNKQMQKGLRCLSHITTAATEIVRDEIWNRFYRCASAPYNWLH